MSARHSAFLTCTSPALSLSLPHTHSFSARCYIVAAMAPKKGSVTATRAQVKPMLLASTIKNTEGLDKLNPLMANPHNDHGATQTWSGSKPAMELTVTTFLFLFHSVFGVLLPPFSNFFHVVLEYYQLQALHLHPNSILLLSIVAFFCEAFLGMMTSMLLFRTFYNMGRKQGPSGKEDAEGNLASLQAQVGGVSDVVQNSRDDATRAQTMQAESAKVFCTLAQRDRGVVSHFIDEVLHFSITDADVGYLDFFAKLVETLEIGSYATSWTTW
ncbi:retrotransposon protein [Hordeum vulgare]|nr:retrotransposon protein [Hordeum vulgare]